MPGSPVDGGVHAGAVRDEHDRSLDAGHHVVQSGDLRVAAQPEVRQGRHGHGTGEAGGEGRLPVVEDVVAQAGHEHDRGRGNGVHMEISVL